MPSRTSARYLAPAALVAAAVAVYLVGFNGSSDGGSDSGTPSSTTKSSGAGTGTAKRRTPAATTQQAKTYTVQPGDVLSAIADKTGVSVERLQQLNPDADAQSLRIGQTLKLAP